MLYESKDPDKKEIIVSCECRTHLLVIHEDIMECDHENTDNEESDKNEGESKKTNHANHQAFDLAIFEYGQYSKKHSFWNRLKFAWKHLRTGKWYSDNIILTPDDAENVANFLIAKTKTFKDKNEKLIEK